jgi:hypothetical protein
MWVITQPKNRKRPLILNLAHAQSVEAEDVFESRADGGEDTDALLGVRIGAHFQGQRWPAELVYIPNTVCLEENVTAAMNHLTDGLDSPGRVIDLRPFASGELVDLECEQREGLRPDG